MIRTAQAGLEIAKYGVNPKEFGELFRFATTGHHGIMLATRFGYRSETGQTVRKYAAICTEVGFGLG